MVHYFFYYNHNPIPKIIKNVTVTGIITEIQDNADKPRIILTINDYEKRELPDTIRLNITESDYKKFNYDDTITADIFLAPPAKPLFEGAYNFEFYAQLHGLGATGRINNIIDHLPTQKFSFAGYIQSIRLNIANNLLNILPIETVSPIIAMITGARFYIPETIQYAWKASGIYHLLSISGLHMTIIAGICFVVIRRLLLCIPALAHGGYVKKITALCVIPLAYGYVLLSGGDVPVMRSYIMVCVGLIALLCNQRMITLRSACIAFCLVLIINPIDIFNIGFALSFAAVFGIIIAMNLINYLKKHYTLSTIKHFIIVNIFAGYAGMPLALYVFNSNALLGLCVNMLAIPLTSMVIMPFMVLGVVMMPVGLYEYSFMLVGWGVDILNYLSLYVADLPFAILYHQSPWLIWIILFYISIYLFALNTQQSIKTAVCFLIISIAGHIVSPRYDYLKLFSEKTIFYINKENELTQLVHYDKSYVNPYLKEQVLLHFGKNPESVYYYEKCIRHKTYVTLSGFKFKCS